jgi:carotenoid cleavage dioxygenase
VVNTNIIAHAGKLFAVVEAGSLPVELDFDLETVARSDFGGTLPGGFTAHPKLDPHTGELHAAVYSPFGQHIQYVVVDADGAVRRAVNVPTPGHPMVHDCGITSRYFILLDLPVVFDLEVLNQGFQLPYRWHPEYGARVGLLPREGEAADVVWCEVDPCFVFHPMNAYDDADGRVVMDVCRHPKIFDTDLRGPNEGRPTLDRWVIDPETHRVSGTRLDDRPQEFPRHDERRVGRPYRFGYTAGAGSAVTFDTLIKHDLQRGTSEVHAAPAGVGFMEPVFVPASADAAEDEGWVLAYTYDARRGASDVIILEARDFTAPPVARIELPVRVPYGFHGNWVAEDG